MKNLEAVSCNNSLRVGEAKSVQNATSIPFDTKEGLKRNGNNIWLGTTLRVSILCLPDVTALPLRICMPKTGGGNGLRNGLRT